MDAFVIPLLEMRHYESKEILVFLKYVHCSNLLVGKLNIMKFENQITQNS